MRPRKPKLNLSIKSYLLRNKEFWQYLPEDLQEAARIALFEKQPIKNANTTLFKASVLLHREKKCFWYHTKGYDYIEGLRLHHTHPSIYNVLKACRVHTLHDLRRFIPTLALKSAAGLRLKYPQLIELYHWWHTEGANACKREPARYSMHTNTGKSGH